MGDPFTNLKVDQPERTDRGRCALTVENVGRSPSEFGLVNTKPERFS